MLHHIIADKRHSGCDKFCNFRRQLTHTSIAKMLLPLQESFTKPEVNHCPDGHFRRTIYGAGPYIADYPEQCLLTAIVQGWCPKYANFYYAILQLMTPFRCMAPNDNLEQEAISRTQKLTDELAKFHELGELWEKFGIVGDIVVCSCYLSVYSKTFNNETTAFHCRYPAGRYQRIDISRHTAPIDQGDV